MIIEQGFAGSSGFLLARLGAEARRLWARMLAEHDLTPHQFGVLMALDSLGESYQQRLCGFVGIDPRNAVRVVDALRRRELLVRAPDPADRRRHLLRLSPAGAGLVSALRSAGEVIEGDLLGSLDPDERATLHRLLHKVFGSVHGGAE
ncbi:MarR family winged helix-turn-helix transcriptional regulator [Actinophytocola sp.]|uniref:MarR family winged helix-turn-helix transcriptional regulator n=1 Tax=Actinophytocola sp. TaxID=1872138 RepID=UPI002D7FC8D0|nr:MarR family winged helix-turn-helix transcriptional regulator [Actinophytocola sp.]HET9141582.1 MarR family winged helix-turn-helix transcriptional regulator [Actinophytocola sp.]